ncbi:hypothetical protein ACFWN1_05740 [Streptomyces sp. NPDC058459]|uniref:hypothetical protein n=1 Tax=Streptomyces sp. NPDC058459 TaxID=3346508 RepID=UPI003651B17B
MSANLTDPVRDFLAAISEVLTLPEPAATLGDLIKFKSEVDTRTHRVQLAIRDLLDGSSDDLAWEAGYLRRHAGLPVRYRTPEQHLTEVRALARGEGQ